MSGIFFLQKVLPLDIDFFFCLKQHKYHTIPSWHVCSLTGKKTPESLDSQLNSRLSLKKTCVVVVYNFEHTIMLRVCSEGRQFAL